MKIQKIRQGLLAGFVLFAVVGMFCLAQRAEARPLGETANTVAELAAAGDDAALQDFLADMSIEERVAVVRELAEGMRGRRAEKVFEPLFKALIMLQPTNGMDALAAAVEASQGNQTIVKSAMQGLIAGTMAHPSLENEEQRLAALARTAEAAAATVVRVAEENDRINAVGVAYAVAHGGVLGVDVGENGSDRMKTVGEALARGGVGAAVEKNKPGVARAMMLALAHLQDVEARRAAVAGLMLGGEAEGGEPAVALMVPLREQLVHVIPLGPAPVAPELPIPPGPDEARTPETPIEPRPPRPEPVTPF